MSTPDIPRKVRVDADLDLEVLEYLETTAAKYGVSILDVAAGCLQAGIQIDRETRHPAACRIVPFPGPPLA